MTKLRPLEDADWAGISDEKRRAAFEWGLAGLLMGTALMLIAPGAMLCNMYLWTTVAVTLDQTSLQLVSIGALIGAPGMLVLCTIAIVFGAKGLRRARWYDQPAAVPIAAILVSSMALFLWIGVGADLIMITQTFVRGG